MIISRPYVSGVNFFPCRAFFASAFLLLFNGTSFSQPDTWNPRTNFGGAARERTVGMEINGMGYVGTGANAAGTCFKDWWQYDPVANAWTQMADMPTFALARSRAVGLSISGKGYVMTGRDQGNNPLSSVFEYDPGSNSWNTTPMNAFPGNQRYSAAGFVIGNKGYLAVGFDGSTEFNGLFEYNPATDNWSNKTGFPGSPRYSAVGFSIGNYGYVGSGYDDNGNYVKDFYRYNPATDSWLQIADLPQGVRAIATAFTIGSRGFVVGGSDALNISKQDLWEYNPAADMWIQRASIPVPHQAASSFVIGGKAYVGTGVNSPAPSNVLNDLWQYTPASIITAKFQKTFGGSGSDTDTSNIAFASPTWDGGYIISSTTKSYGIGGEDVFLIKAGPMGNIQWQKTFGTSGNETSASAMQTGDGGFIVAGATRKTTDEDMLILKISGAGSVLWTKSLGGAQNSRANYAEETRAGGEYLIIGKGEMTGPTVSNTCLLKFTTNGTQVLARDITVTSSIDEGYSLEQTDFGNYLISGNMKPGTNSTDAYIVGMDEFGGFVSGTQGRYDSPGAGTDIRAMTRQTADGGFIICGSSNGIGTHGLFDFFLLKVQNDMSISWGKIYGGPQDDFARSIAVTNDDNIVVAGYTKSFGSATDAFLSMIDPGGTVLWTKTYGGSASDKFNSVHPALDGGYLLCGETFSFGSPANGSEIYLVKTDSIGSSGCNESNISLTPNNFAFIRTPVGGNMNVMTVLTPPVSANNGSASVAPLCSQCTFPIGKTKTNVKCFGGSTGMAAVSALGGAMPYTYAWSTGATTQAISNLPVGTYSVLVTDANLCTAIDTVKIVQPLPLLNASAGDSVDICKGASDTLDADPSGGTPAYSYQWSPATGLSCTTCQYVQANPSGSTNYVVTITDANLCNRTDTVVVNVHSPPAASAGTDQTICVGGNTNIGNPSVAGMNYSWSPAAGLSNATLSNPSASPVTTTTYVITVSNQIGCASKDTVVVNVLPTPTLSISPPSTSFPLSICSGSSISLTASSNVSNYQWSTGSSNATIVVSPSTQTGYTVTVSIGSCSVSASTTVSVIPVPVANIVNNGSTTICTGTPVLLTGSGNGSYQWSTGSTATSVSVSYPSPGTYITTLTVTAGGGNVACSDVDSITLVAVTAPVVSATATSYTLCTGIVADTLIATNLAGANYAWSPGTHPNNDTILIGPFSVPGTITYSVVVSTGSGCAGTATVSITVSAGYPAPAVTPNPSAHCFGQPNQAFTCTNPLALVGWADLSGNLLQLGPVFTPTVTAAGTYSFICLQGSGQYCLSNPTIVSLTIYNSPTANAGANVTICPGHTAALQASGGTGYQWNPPGFLSTATISNPSTSPDSTVSYEVLVTDANGCSDRDSVTVFVLVNDTCSIHIYNVFTPNNDGLNEGWWIDGINSFPANTVSIHNRWGDLVWKGDNYDNTKIVWKGLNEKGNPLPAGTYYYVITIKEKRYSSWVELLK